jgi:hypothetical protein
LLQLLFIETVFHILNRNLPLGTKVWPPGSHDFNPFDYLKCGVSGGINRSSHKKIESLITTIMEVFRNIPRGDLKGMQPLPVQARGGRYCQCCGSGSTGSTCFWASRIRIHQSEVWIRILLSTCKNSKKNLDSYQFVTLFDFLSLKNDVNVPSKSNKLKKLC